MVTLYKKIIEKGKRRNRKCRTNNKWKIIIFRNFCGDYITKPLNTKEAIYTYIFDYVNMEFPQNFPDIKTYARNYKIKLNKDDKRRCAWVLIKRC